MVAAIRPILVVRRQPMRLKFPNSDRSDDVLHARVGVPIDRPYPLIGLPGPRMRNVFEETIGPIITRPDRPLRAPLRAIASRVRNVGYGINGVTTSMSGPAS